MYYCAKQLELAKEIEDIEKYLNAIETLEYYERDLQIGGGISSSR